MNVRKIQLIFLMFFQLFFVFGESDPSTVDDDTKFVLDLVRGGVPVGIIQLFLPSVSKGATGPCLRATSDSDINGMCKFVKAFAEDYASNPTNDWNSCSKEDYVCNAIYRAATSNNTQNFSCSLWQQKSIRNRIGEKMLLDDTVKITDKLKTSRRQGLFLGMASSKDCSKTCSARGRPVCSVSALLLDFLPKLPPNCPEPATSTMPGKDVSTISLFSYIILAFVGYIAYLYRDNLSRLIDNRRQ
ncbi:uncharacterized protein LOC134193221 isoform X2 [Corticium candelabrum]|uniref:uncharacterized protein LOC134193221 isoform X2 n=1 Tax=Corticium candelabrum TaxID=121492 RepID=UPI002E258197|nr:uncharacterized protein LOC134193221 isoform X2 [Corticium candelabrum]